MQNTCSACEALTTAGVRAVSHGCSQVRLMGVLPYLEHCFIPLRTGGKDCSFMTLQPPFAEAECVLKTGTIQVFFKKNLHMVLNKTSVYKNKHSSDKILQACET